MRLISACKRCVVPFGLGFCAYIKQHQEEIIFIPEAFIVTLP